MNQTSAATLTEKIFIEGPQAAGRYVFLRRGRVRALRATLRASDDARIYYDSLMSLDGKLRGAVTGTPTQRDHLSSERLAFLCDEFFDSHIEASREKQPIFFALPRLVGGLAIMLALVGGVMLLPPTDPAPTAAFMSRGIPAATSREEGVAIRVFGVPGENSQFDELQVEPGDPAVIKGQQRLRFAYGNTGKARHLVIVAVDAEGKAAWLPKTGQSMPLSEAYTPKVLSGEIDVGDFDLKNDIRVYAVFSDDPLPRAAIEEAVRGVGTPAMTQRLELPRAMQDGLWIKHQGSRD
jgi:hypothetical protein